MRRSLLFPLLFVASTAAGAIFVFQNEEVNAGQSRSAYVGEVATTKPIDLPHPDERTTDAIAIAEPSATPLPEPTSIPTPAIREPQSSTTESAETSVSIEPPSFSLSEDMSEFLSLHNDVRSDLGIPPLVWSDPLAQGAAQWAHVLAMEQCSLRHSNEPYGENLFSLWSSDGSVRGTPNDAMKWWIDEKASYEYDTNTCKDDEECGHYTQIVWRDTTAVGCAVTTCESGTATRDLFVCRYAPQGNIIGKKPY